MALVEGFGIGGRATGGHVFLQSNERDKTKLPAAKRPELSTISAVDQTEIYCYVLAEKTWWSTDLHERLLNGISYSRSIGNRGALHSISSTKNRLLTCTSPLAALYSLVLPAWSLPSLYDPELSAQEKEPVVPALRLFLMSITLAYVPEMRRKTPRTPTAIAHAALAFQTVVRVSLQ